VHAPRLAQVLKHRRAHRLNLAVVLHIANLNAIHKPGKKSFAACPQCHPGRRGDAGASEGVGNAGLAARRTGGMSSGHVIRTLLACPIDTLSRSAQHSTLNTLCAP
jgi:cytochrome c2